MKRVITVLTFIVAASILVGCQSGDSDPAASDLDSDVQPTVVATASPTEVQQTGVPSQTQELAPPEEVASEVLTSEMANYGYTHQRADGNRLVSGRGAMPEATVIDIPLTGQPAWIVGAAVPAGFEDQPDGQGYTSAWAVVMEDGRVQAFLLRGEQVSETTIEPVASPDIPPLLKVTGNGLALLRPPAPVYGSAPPAILDGSDRQAVVSPEGLVTVMDANGTAISMAVSPPLPDGRLLVDERQRLLFLSQPTTRYDHGIAGDAIEAAAVTLFAPQEESDREVVIPIPAPAVVEGIMPLWADLDGDGRREIIVTQSDAGDGSQIVVYDESGQRLAAGPAIGQGYRWRHQLAVAPFGPQGEIELVDVLTPHIGGVVEFYQLRGDKLQIVATVPGYTSHVIGSRNLDMALAGDLDGDGQIELLLPNQARDHLGAIRRTAGGAEVAWSVPLEGVVNTNLAAVRLPDDSLLVGAGLEDGTLRLWLPR